MFYAFGPGLLGILRDAFGGYGVPLMVCLSLNLAATAMILMRPAPAYRHGQLRNLRPCTTLSTILRGPWRPMPTKSSASLSAAATAARLSISLPVVNIGSM